MPSSGMTLRTSCTIRCGVTGKRSSSARSLMRARISCRRFSEIRIRIELAAEPVGQQREARADVADHLGVREEDLLDVGRREADVDDLAGRPRP